MLRGSTLGENHFPSPDALKGPQHHTWGYFPFLGTFLAAVTALGSKRLWEEEEEEEDEEEEEEDEQPLAMS